MRDDEVTAISAEAEIRESLLELITDAGLNLDEAYWFTIRGNNEMSLSSLTMLTEERYAALLLAGKLVTIRGKGKGLQVMSSKYTHWDTLVEGAGLTSKDGGLDIAEVTQSRVRLDAFKRRKKGIKLSGIRKDLLQIRIGKYPEGTTTKASLQLTD